MPKNDPFFQPVSAMDLARFAGVPSFMRLPVVPTDHPRFTDVDIGILGVPWDRGTTNRPGAPWAAAIARPLDDDPRNESCHPSSTI